MKPLKIKPSIIIYIAIIQIFLILAKVNGNIDWSWLNVMQITIYTVVSIVGYVIGFVICEAYQDFIKRR